MNGWHSGPGLSHKFTHHLPVAVPSCVVTVTLYANEAGELALRKTMADALFSDTLYSTGSKSTVISTGIDNEQMADTG